MPTTPGLSRKYPDCHLAPRKYAMVISCVDCRLLDDLVRFLDHDNLTNRYYQVAYAGAAIGLSDSAPDYYPQCSPSSTHRHDDKCVKLDFSCWKAMLYDHVELVLNLTKGDVTDIYIIEHRDCGAYKAFLGDDGDYYGNPSAPLLEDERLEHKKRAEELAKEIREWFATDRIQNLICELRGIQRDTKKVVTPLVRGFLMDLRGNVEPLFDPTIQKAKRTRKQTPATAASEAYV